MRAHPLKGARARAAAEALPADPSVARLDEATRHAIAAHWMHRASAELGVALAFEALRPRLEAVDAAPAVLHLADKAIEDERRHGALCARLAARYRDDDDAITAETCALPEPRDSALPDFGTGDEHLEVALIVIGMCCVNESIASEWIRASLELASDAGAAIAIAANKAHLRDEIDHARLGWAHVASAAVTPALRAALRPWVPKLLDVNTQQWKVLDPFLPPDGVRAHGHLSAAESRDAVDAAVRDVVLPGFAHVDLL